MRVNFAVSTSTDEYVTIGMRKSKDFSPMVPMIRLSDVKQTEVDWLWYPYIPFGKLTIIQGNPDEGKTFLAMQLAQHARIENFFHRWNHLSHLM